MPIIIVLPDDLDDLSIQPSADQMLEVRVKRDRPAQQAPKKPRKRPPIVVLPFHVSGGLGEGAGSNDSGLDDLDLDRLEELVKKLRAQRNDPHALAPSQALIELTAKNRLQLRDIDDSHKTRDVLILRTKDP